MYSLRVDSGLDYAPPPEKFLTPPGVTYISASLLGPNRDALRPLLIFREGVHSPENLEA